MASKRKCIFYPPMKIYTLSSSSLQSWLQISVEMCNCAFRDAAIHGNLEIYFKMERLQLMLLGVFSQIYPNSMESRLTPSLHAVPIESRSNSKKIYCFVPHLQQTYESEKEKSLRCDHFRNLFCRWPLFRFTATQDRPNLWGNTFFGRGTASQILYLFVGNYIHPVNMCQITRIDGGSFYKYKL